MNLKTAKPLAKMLLQTVQPYCTHAFIAGSIRREKAEVKDIELVVVPRWEEDIDPTDLFAERVVPVNRLYQAVAGGIALSEVCPAVQWIKPSTSVIQPWPLQPEGKYWRGYLPEQQVKLDVFLATSKNVGAIFLIRTGSMEFGRAVMTHAQTVGYRFIDGSLQYQNANSYTPVVTPDEETVFRLLRLRFVEPQQRTGPEAVKELPRYARPNK